MNFEKVSPTPPDKKLLGDESVERLLSIVWFNLSRKENTSELKEIFMEVLEKIKRRNQMNHDPIKTLEYLEMVLCTIAYTRDIRYGKGERDLSYMMIYALYKFFPIPAIYLMKEIVGQNEESYGSWKDISRLCDYIKKETNEHNPLIITLVEMATNRLKRDEREESPSNVAKWIPREGSKYGWLFDIFVKTYYQLSVAPTNKNRSNFRKLVSRTNREIGTADKPKSKHMPPIKDLHLCTFKTPTPEGRAVMSERGDADCAFSRRERNGVNFSIPIDAFIKKAKKITDNSEKKRLDDQWEKYSKQWSALNKNIIPLIDVSAEMSEPEYNGAIGIGILLSQNSLLQNRLICFSQTASWISLNRNLGFTDTVKEIMNVVPPPTTRLINAGFDLIKDAILETKMKKDQIDDLEIVVVSNFANDTCNDDITEKKVKGKPKLTYWNISQNMTIPNKGKNIKYIAGHTTLEEFISNKLPIETMIKILSNPRYDKIRNMFENLRSE